MARCGCGTTCSCAIVGGDGIKVSGIGSHDNPYVITGDPAGECEQIVKCVGGAVAQPLSFDGGKIGLCLSKDAGNALKLGTDNCLYGDGGATGEVVGPRAGEWKCSEAPGVAKENALRRDNTHGLYVPDTGMSRQYFENHYDVDRTVDVGRAVYIGRKTLSITNHSACKNLVVQGTLSAQPFIALAAMDGGQQLWWYTRAGFELEGSIESDGEQSEARQGRQLTNELQMWLTTEMNHSVTFRIAPGATASVSFDRCGLVHVANVNIGADKLPTLIEVFLQATLYSWLEPDDESWPGSNAVTEPPPPIIEEPMPTRSAVSFYSYSPGPAGQR